MSALYALIPLCAIVGAYIGTRRSFGTVGGFVLGLLLGPLGVLIAALTGRYRSDVTTTSPVPSHDRHGSADDRPSGNRSV